jgi:N-acyl-D-amino-acid deacylase
MDLIRAAQAYEAETGEDDVESVIAVSMAEEDVETMIRWPWVAFSTDGELVGAHPRGRGAFPRVLGEYVRERRVLRLEEAVRKMTSLPAAALGLEGVGVVAVGHPADLVLFDPQTVADRATTEDPLALAVGIEKVWVGGEPVYEPGRATGLRPGRVLRRAGAQATDAFTASPDADRGQW